MLIAKTSGNDLPKEKTLRNCEWSNRDGCGVAWADGSGRVKIKKDFKDLDALIAWLPGNIKRDDAALIHFRQATAGGVSVGLRHPFPVSSVDAELLAPEIETDLAMGHNGVIWSMPDKAKMSDTSQFIKTIISDPNIKRNIRENDAIQILISGMIGESNKLAFLYPDGYILTFGKFEKDHGILYSNSQFKDWGDYKPYESRFPKLLESVRERVAKNNKKSNITTCCICFREFETSSMVMDISPGAIDGDMLCRACFEYVGNKSRKPRVKKGGVYLSCGLCGEFFEQSDLTELAIPAYLNEGKAGVVLACTDCELECSQPDGGLHDAE